MITVNDFLAEYELVGYTVEMRYWIRARERMTKWEPYWNHKCYKTEAVANECIAAISKWLTINGYEFRVRPLYAKRTI